MSLPASKGPEVVQKKIGQDRYPDSNGRSDLKTDREKTGKHIKQSHIHEYARASDNAEFYELFQPFGIDFKPSHILNISVLPTMVKYSMQMFARKINCLRTILYRTIFFFTLTSRY
jgi:hypothetical protein